MNKYPYTTPGLRMALTSHLAHGDRDKSTELLKLSDKELWQEFDKHCEEFEKHRWKKEKKEES
ncbi:hypothetical protein GH146_01710 [archaeon]|jgi:hypothetical protein|nr:hypothetical protein [archaeon]